MAVVSSRPVRGPHDYEEYALPSPAPPSLSSSSLTTGHSPSSQSTDSQVRARDQCRPRILPQTPVPPFPALNSPSRSADHRQSRFEAYRDPIEDNLVNIEQVKMLSDRYPPFRPTVQIPEPVLPARGSGYSWSQDAHQVDQSRVVTASSYRYQSPASTTHNQPPFPVMTASVPNGYSQPPSNATIFSPRPTSPPPTAHIAYPSTSSTSTSATTTIAPPITHPFPTIESLEVASAKLESFSDKEKIAWAQDVWRALNRYIEPHHNTNHTDTSRSNSRIPPPLLDLLNLALPIIISSSTHADRSISTLASYLKGIFLSSGICPDYLPRDPRQAFKEFETAARGGDMRGWFKLARDYEGVGDMARAKDCLERGIRKGDCESTYRMGMAHLLGQLDVPPNPAKAIPLLQRAASNSTIHAPHPSYVYGMLLADELQLPPSASAVPPHLFGISPSNPADAQTERERLAREAIERAAYLCHPPAQHKCGFLYEHASLGYPYDPLMSVQWYSLGSQGGEVEADMALSKWFLCGAEGHFGKNEDLARTFAEKAARKGHPNGCFAMGYYYELGIGGKADTDQAKKWYHRAAKRNNLDAIARLHALSAPQPCPISIAQHEAKIHDTLIRKRTLARMRSERQGYSRPPPRRRSDEERIRLDTQRAANLAAIPVHAFAMSPTPRVGEIMSPGAYFPPRMPQTVVPSRPPIPHQAFSNGGSMSSSSTGSAYSFPSPRRNGEVDRVALQDNGVGAKSGSPGGVKEQREERHRAWDSGPQTFAEMGFVSKPVEEEGCLIM